MRGGLLSLMALSACAAEEAPAVLSYGGVEARLLESDLINVRVRVANGSRADVLAYAECAAARYTLDRRASFARHVRTNVSEVANGLEAEAVYLIAQSLPRGSKTIDAEVVVAACGTSGIPTV